MEYEIIVKAVKELGYPTEGETAAALWQWLSSMHGPAPSTAKRIYLELGYKPFAGYPLERKG